MSASIVGLARERGLLELRTHDLRDWTRDKHRTTDDYPYGGGPGLVMKPEPIFEAVDAVQLLEDEPGLRGLPHSRRASARPGRSSEELAEQGAPGLGVRPLRGLRRAGAVARRPRAFDRRLRAHRRRAAGHGRHRRGLATRARGSRRRGVGRRRVVRRRAAGVPSVHAPRRVSRDGSAGRAASAATTRRIAAWRRAAVGRARPPASGPTCWHARR